MQEADNTVGIQNSLRTVGIQYYLDGTYNALGVPITDTFAMKYTPIAPTMGVVEEGGLSAILGARRLMVFPSVTRGRLNIAYGVPAGSKSVELKVYDIGGRLVKSFAQLTGLPVNQMTWHGDDEAGRAVAAGVYFVKLTVDGKESVVKAVLLR
jgi:hypothetical protein